MREMKDSGVPWIGMIPKGWTVHRIKTLFSERIELSDTGNETLLSVSEYYGVDSRSSHIDEDEFLSRSESLIGYKKCYPGDIVSNIMLAWKGSLGVAKQPGIVSPAYCVYKPANGVYPVYYHYLFRTSLYTWQFKCYSKGIIDSRLRLYSPFFFDIPALIPPTSEQQYIANALDEKDAEIDSIIERTRASIDEYRKLKQAVITEAVTKGVCGSREMKDSGLEWMGSIPVEWCVSPLKKLIRMPLQYGANESGIPYSNELPRYVRITDIRNNRLRDDLEMQSLTEEQAKGFILEHEDILFARSGGTVGKAFIFQESYGRCAFAGYLIRAKIIGRISPWFVYYFTQSSAYDEWKKQIFIQSTIQNIGADRYSQLRIPCPPLIEQKQIVSYLDEKCAAIDSLITAKESLISELGTYKKSLIYEYVTGGKTRQ